MHSNTRTGFRIEKLISRLKSCEAVTSTTNFPIRNTVQKLTAYKNIDKAVLLQELGQTTITDITVMDVGNTGIYLLNTDYQPGNVTLNNSLVVGKTSMNGPTNTQGFFGQNALGTPNSPNFYVNNTRFFNFESGSFLFTPYMSLFLPSPSIPVTDYAMTFFRNITFGNIQGGYVRWTGMQRELYEDLDGSLAKAYFNTPSVQQNFTRSTLFMLQPHSISAPNCFGNSSSWPQTVLCDRDVRPRVYFITNAQPDHDWYTPMLE